MKYIDRSLVNEPENLKNQPAPSKDEKIIKSIYGHAKVKKALNDLQHGICCYCETRYNAVCPGDVEHFRPKQGWQQDRNDKTLHEPGYYWLAYKWENLLYACELCNRTYKHNYFPLEDPAKRFDPAVRDISAEKPLLINPYEEQHPEIHLKFEGVYIKGLTPEGKASIDYYGLDRKELNELRQEVYNDINVLVDLATISHAYGGAMEKEVKDRLKARIEEKIEAGQHTLMIKWNFNKYRY